MFEYSNYPDLLIGLKTPDDAAVWRLDEDRAMVLTTDFFTPIVDNPYDYGAIAAANALSDVYAMGGIPAFALNVAAIPADLPAEVTSEIIRGGAEKCREAGVVIAGGHTIRDDEPKYGLVVVGFVNPKCILTKANAKVGDKLVLTKPLGFGVTTTALKRELADERDVTEAVDWMKKLNREASNLAVDLGVRCVTDITGFSLLGHGVETAEASKVKFLLHCKDIPFISCAQKYARMNTFAGGALDNRKHYEGKIHFANTIELTDRMLLFDPQTSGGLLISVPDEAMLNFQDQAKKRLQPFWIIGEVVPGKGIDVD
jgi:selenide,water dikinase